MEYQLTLWSLLGGTVYILCFVTTSNIERGVDCLAVITNGGANFKGR